jgi:hypothetical protein
MDAAHQAGASAALQFQPLDTSIVSEALAAFLVGRNKYGFWVARDPRGQFGAIFLLKHSALSFARRHSRPAGCATIFPSETFELDLANKGNPLLPYLGSLMQLATMIKQFYPWAFAILLAGGGGAGLIALRTAIFVWRFHH